MFAGQPFHCAVTYFPGDNLSKAEGKALEEVPHCSGCPEGKVIHCACQSFVKRFTRPSLQTHAFCHDDLQHHFVDVRFLTMDHMLLSR